MLYQKSELSTFQNRYDITFIVSNVHSFHFKVLFMFTSSDRNATTFYNCTASIHI